MHEIEAFSESVNIHSNSPDNFPILYSETTTEYGYRDIAGLEGQTFLASLGR